jgi:hypothetical protein
MLFKFIFGKSVTKSDPRRKPAAGNKYRGGSQTEQAVIRREERKERQALIDENERLHRLQVALKKGK